MADLYHVRAGVLLIRGAHALGVLHRERHRLFLIDVFAGGERVGEVLAVQVLRRRDQDRDRSSLARDASQNDALDPQSPRFNLDAARAIRDAAYEAYNREQENAWRGGGH